MRAGGLVEGTTCDELLRLDAHVLDLARGGGEGGLQVTQVVAGAASQ